MKGKITDFFKKFQVPLGRVPQYANDEDEIVVRSPSKKRRPAATPEKAKSPRKQYDGSSQSSLRSIPSQTSPGKSPGTRSSGGLSDGSNDRDDEVYHSSPTSATQRRLSAVAVPSPKRQRSPTPPSSFQLPASVPPKPPNASFDSTSTLSSVPLSSQSLGRRICRDGLQGVPNSDSGSDSDEDLVDPSFFTRKRTKLSPPAAQNAKARAGAKRPDRKSARLLNQDGNSRASTPAAVSRPGPLYKHSLARIVEAKQERANQEARIAELEAKTEEVTKRRERLAALTAKDVDREAMAAEMAEDSDEKERVMQAMARTEALVRDDKFVFFRDLPPRKRRRAFPVEALGGRTGLSPLKGKAEREQACLTGYVAAVAERRGLRGPVRQWFADELLHETRDELREAYVEILRQAASHDSHPLDHIEVSLTDLYQTALASELMAEPDGLDVDKPSSTGKPKLEDDVLKCICGHERKIGVSVACESCNTWQHSICYYPQYLDGKLPKELEHKCVECEPRTIDITAARKARRAARADATYQPEIAGIAPGLRYVAHATACTMACSDAARTGRVIAELALALLDEDVSRDAHTVFAIKDSIETILESSDSSALLAFIASFESTFLAPYLLDPSQQCDLITSLPATAPTAHLFRRHLAIRHLTHRNSALDDLTSPSTALALLQTLRTDGAFTIHDSTDYALLHSLISLLDIAIDCGFSDFAFLAGPEPAVVGPFARPAPPPREELAFNKQIDAFTSELRRMSNKIKDAGAVHLRRTEAKSRIERCVVRLSHAVRTREKARKDVFGGGSVEQKGMIEGFAKAHVIKEPRAGAVQEERGSPRETIAGRGGDCVAVAAPAVAGAEASPEKTPQAFRSIDFAFADRRGSAWAGLAGDVGG